MKAWLSVAVLATFSYGALALISEGLVIPDPLLVAVLSAITLANYLIKAERWRMLLYHYGMEVSRREAARTYIAGLFFVLTPAKSGEVLKGELMKARHGFSRKKVVFITLVERAFDMAAHLVLAGLGALFVAGAYLKDLVLVGALGAAGVAGLYAFRHRLEFIRDEMEQLHDLRLALASLALSVVAWGLEAWELSIAAGWMGSKLGLLESFFVFSGSSIFGNLLMLPGGLGAAEAGMVSLLLLFGMGKGLATGLTVVIRLTTLWLGFAMGAALWFTSYNRPLRKPEK